MSSLQSQHLIQALHNPDIYPHCVDNVLLIQTHISWIVIAGEFVYKVKKPVDFGFLDFSTLHKRRYYCQQEVSLNQRLCPDLYLGVVPIREKDGAFRIGGRDGRIVEYAVQMHRLPRERMLDNMLATKQVTGEVIEAIADKVAAFHENAGTDPNIARFGSERTIEQNWTENFEQTREFIGDTITQFQFDYLENWVHASMTRNRHLFQQRVRKDRIRDGHGDLRASAICVDNGICIFDCIEFNRRFRYSDVASDVAFLAMDLRAKRHPELSQRFVNRYVARSGDVELQNVLPFYASYRAYVRGKVESLRAVDTAVDPHEQDEARQIARDRFALAVEFAFAQQPPLLVITCGHSGSGKSAIATLLSEQDDWTVIASDVVRKELAGLDPTERQHGDFRAGIYSHAFTRRTYEELLNRAHEPLLGGRSVVLDATFSSREWRSCAAALADETGALFFCLECRAPSEEIHQRLTARESDRTATSDATWETYVAQRSTFEPVSELSDWQHIVVDTNQALDNAVDSARSDLDSRLHPTQTNPQHSHDRRRTR